MKFNLSNLKPSKEITINEECAKAVISTNETIDFFISIILSPNSTLGFQRNVYGKSILQIDGVYKGLTLSIVLGRFESIKDIEFEIVFE